MEVPLLLDSATLLFDTLEGFISLRASEAIRSRANRKPLEDLTTSAMRSRTFAAALLRPAAWATQSAPSGSYPGRVLTLTKSQATHLLKRGPWAAS
jgi:hypothetical protein